jgi:hypothetical protein
LSTASVAFIFVSKGKDSKSEKSLSSTTEILQIQLQVEPLFCFKTLSQVFKVFTKLFFKSSKL